MTPGFWLNSMHPSSFQVQRPFDFLTPVFISVFQFTSVRVSLCCKSINISNVDSGANSYLTNPLDIKALIETRHHTPELPFWYFHICLEGIYVNIIVEEHWNWAASSLYLKDRKILLFIFFLYRGLYPLFCLCPFPPPPHPAVILDILFPTKPLTEMVPEDLFFSFCSKNLFSLLLSPSAVVWGYLTWDVLCIVLVVSCWTGCSEI